ncbi:MAG: uroporphyrinogen decarboxylase family protein, partial [Anaerolineae bacterium]
IMLDLYQRPEKVLAACDRMVDVVFRSVLEKTTPDSIPGVFMPLHKGLDTFMSPEHFQTFYWPSLKKLILKLIDEGFVPWLFTEGKYNTRLEIIKDLPKGKAVYWFNTTDIFKAKEVLGSVGCIHGGVPVSMMTACEPEEVTAYCRRLIETVGAGGGYILDLGAGPEKARAENLHAMIRAAKEYGVYKE